jgi:hypothetical protein
MLPHLGLLLMLRLLPAPPDASAVHDCCVPTACVAAVGVPPRGSRLDNSAHYRTMHACCNNNQSVNTRPATGGLPCNFGQCTGMCCCCTL